MRILPTPAPSVPPRIGSGLANLKEPLLALCVPDAQSLSLSPLDSPAAGQRPLPAADERLHGEKLKRSVTPNHVVCLEDGKKMKMLKRHLKTDHNLTPKEYRERWGLPSDYPMTAPNYAKARSALAKKIGLGRKRRNVKAKGKGAMKK